MLTIQRRGIIDTYNQFSFSRSSTAFDSRGRLYLPHNARFEPGKFGQAVLIEEFTTNLLTANQSSVESDLTGIVASYPSDVTITRDTTVAWHGSASAKVECKVASNYRGIRIGPLSLTNGVTYTFSAYVRGANGGEKVMLAVAKGGPWVASSSLVTLTTSFQRITLTWTCNETRNDYYLEIGQHSNSSPTTFFYDGGQVEQKSYATSWVLGGTTRSSETITVPTTGILQPQAGTIEFWAYVNAQVRDTSRVRRFFSHNPGPGNANRITIQHNNTSHWVFTIADGAGNTHSIEVSDSYTPDGWHYFAMVWDSNRFAVFIDGVKHGEVSNPTYLPQSLSSTFDIGHSLGNLHANTLIGPVRISNIARSDEEITAAYNSGQPLQADQYTTLLLNFDGPDAQRGARTIYI